MQKSMFPKICDACGKEVKNLYPLKKRKVCGGCFVRERYPVRNQNKQKQPTQAGGENGGDRN